MNKPRKRPIIGTKFGPTRQTEYISEYLHQAVPFPKEKPKRVRITGARVMKRRQKTERIRKRKKEEGKRSKAKTKEREQNTKLSVLYQTK